jgi:hypothetical protein
MKRLQVWVRNAVISLTLTSGKQSKGAFVTVSLKGSCHVESARSQGSGGTNSLQIDKGDPELLDLCRKAVSACSSVIKGEGLVGAYHLLLLGGRYSERIEKLPQGQAGLQLTPKFLDDWSATRTLTPCSC